MLNRINFMGRFVRDPELRMTQSNIPVASFTVACDRDYKKEETDFINCVAWKQTAEFVSKYFQKGQLAVVSGRLQSRTWTDKDGKKRTEWEVQCDNVYFAESKRSDGYAGGEPQYTAPKAPDVVVDDEELPF